VALRKVKGNGAADTVPEEYGLTERRADRSEMVGIVGDGTQRWVFRNAPKPGQRDGLKVNRWRNVPLQPIEPERASTVAVYRNHHRLRLSHDSTISLKWTKRLAGRAGFLNSRYGQTVRVIRIRQLVVAAANLDATSAEVAAFLGLGEPFHDSAVAEFGLRNAVFAVGDTFLEVVSPTQPGTTAGRFIEKQGGDCGYMVILQVESIDDARNHLRANNARLMWQYDHELVSSSHVHPADIGGAIVSFDEPRPASSWLWGGPRWAEQTSQAVATGLAGVTIASLEPDRIAERWSRLLSTPVADGRRIELPDSSYIQFISSADHPSGVIGFDLWSAKPGFTAETTIANTTFRVIDSLLRR
jgi:Glyoxalase-like domain